MIVGSFKMHGYIYLKNHGIVENLLTEYMQVSRIFLEQSLEKKAKHLLGHDCGFGWLKFEGERINSERTAGDYKEIFNYMSHSGYEACLSVENFEHEVFRTWWQFSVSFFSRPYH